MDLPMTGWLHEVVHSFELTVREALLPNLRTDLLRLVVGVRAALCLMLVLVLSALSQRPDGLDFVLILLAASRRFGRRSEPEHHGFPALTPRPIVIGEAAGSG